MLQYVPINFHCILMIHPSPFLRLVVLMRGLRDTAGVSDATNLPTVLAHFLAKLDGTGWNGMERAWDKQRATGEERPGGHLDRTLSNVH